MFHLIKIVPLKTISLKTVSFCKTSWFWWISNFPVQKHCVGKFPKSSSCEYYQYWGAWTKQQAVGESIHINLSNTQLTSIALTRTLRGNKYFAHFFSIEYLLHLCILCSAIYHIFKGIFFLRKIIDAFLEPAGYYMFIKVLAKYLFTFPLLWDWDSSVLADTRTIMSSVANLWRQEFNDPTLENTPRST